MTKSGGSLPWPPMNCRALPGVSGVGGHVGRAISADQVVGNSSAELWVSIARDANFGETERAVRDVVQGYPGIAHNVLNYSQQTVGDMRSSLEPGIRGPRLRNGNAGAP